MDIMNERYWALRVATADAIGVLQGLVDAGTLDDTPRCKKMAEDALARFNDIRDELDGTKQEERL